MASFSGHWWAEDGYRMTSNYFFPSLCWSLRHTECEGSVFAPLYTTVRPERLTSHVMLRCKIWPSERWTDLCCSVTVITGPVPNNVEPTSPSGRREQSTVYMMQTHIRTSSRKRCAGNPRNDDAHVFGRNEWRNLRHGSERVHINICTWRHVHTFRDGLRYWLSADVHVSTTSTISCLRTSFSFCRTGDPLFV